VVLAVDFELDSLHACVEEVQRRTKELEVASAWREVTGNDGATAMLRRMCSLKLFQKLSSLSFAWSREKDGAAARGWRGSRV
jgi:hypothetical protein